MRFREAVLTNADVQWVQARVRQRVICGFVRRGYLDKDDAKDMGQLSGGGKQQRRFSRAIPRCGSRPMTVGGRNDGSCDLSRRTRCTVG